MQLALGPNAPVILKALWGYRFKIDQYLNDLPINVMIKDYI